MDNPDDPDFIGNSSRDTEWGGILESAAVCVMAYCDEEDGPKEARSPKGKEPVRLVPEPNLVDDGKLEDMTIRRNSSCAHERPLIPEIGCCKDPPIRPALVDLQHRYSSTSLAIDLSTSSSECTYGQLDGAPRLPSQSRRTSFATAIWGPKIGSDSKSNAKSEPVPAVSEKSQAAASKRNPFRKPKGALSMEKEPLFQGSSPKRTSVDIIMDSIFQGETTRNPDSPTWTTSPPENTTHPIQTETSIHHGRDASTYVSPERHPTVEGSVTKGKRSLSIGSETSNPFRSALLTKTTNPITNAGSDSIATMYPYAEYVASIGSPQILPTVGLSSSSSTQQTPSSSNSVTNHTHAIKRSPFCLTECDETEMQPPERRVSHAHTYDPGNIYSIQEIFFSKFVQPEASLAKSKVPPGPKWPKYRYDGYWEWNVARLNGDCSCAEQLFLERGRETFRWLATKFVEYATNEWPTDCKECDTWFNIRDGKVLSQINYLHLTSCGIQMNSSSLAAAIFTIRRHRPRLLGITIQLPTRPKFTTDERSEVSRMVHCFRVLEDMLPRAARLDIVGLENHCKLWSKWLGRERRKGVGRSRSQTADKRYHGRDLRVVSEKGVGGKKADGRGRGAIGRRAMSMPGRGC